ncbi:MAG: DNA mismatch repair endonuclease MutL [Desulfobacterales bacterium]|jgi:DNA mismatch repair protein MutL
MTRIRILPDILSNKIAAGEVVERPASVVKELVENAIDAGARRIVVEIEAGGRRLIRVADDGAGMLRDDALLSLERYATSKIKDDDDLFAIRTLGFRGEALPSIASVSRLTLVSRPAGRPTGTEIRVAGGRIRKVLETGAPPGTMVTVKDLFFNTPARRKFMKTIPTEMGHIGDGLASLALGHPAIDFRLSHNGKTTRQWPAAVESIDRVVDVLGRSLQDQLIPLALESAGAKIRGWVAAPRVNRSTSRGVHLFVNGRHVKARSLLHAVMQGYRQRLMKGQFPLAVCYLSVPADQVDVNVHPTKFEVRFARQRDVHGLVAGAVAAALERADRRLRPGRVAAAGPATALPAGVRETRSPFPHRSSARREASRPLAVAATGPAALPRPPEADQHQARIWRQGRFGDLRVIGQFRETYILCESDEGLVLIDQHAAHERIYYEQLRQRQGQTNAAAQRLLIPETIDLSHREAVLLEDLQASLTPLGMEIEPFGGTTFAIKAAPMMLLPGEIGPVLRDLLETALAAGSTATPEAILEAGIKVMACHGAIRARQTLAARQIRRLLQQLDECANPSHCPHGRPTWIRWTAKALEKAFGRQV